MEKKNSLDDTLNLRRTKLAFFCMFSPKCLVDEELFIEIVTDCPRKYITND